jgi:D-alanyl-lipoteichoic acid acyltransferase DltB (MBOAT superfamily)
MLFNSLDFAIFLPIVFVLYWFVTNKNLKLQNLLVVIASYVFYAWWDWRFLSLVIISTLVDYIVGLGLSHEKGKNKRKALLAASIIINIGILGFFKYYNFFLENFIAAFSFLGFQISANSLSIILPVGISFYTFQTLSYSIDVYRQKIEPTRDLLAFSAFVSFFPQLVAGPIERAVNLLPQFKSARFFDYGKAVDGMRQILWGLFKKIVIADGSAEFANMIFNNSASYSGSTLVLGAFFFAIQIYCDFSGYSDIAIGTARLFGFDLMKNFAFPYFSRDIAEFWRRWHISLTTWFRDYLYIPLGGSRGSNLKVARNILIIFVVSGFWHGAKWTFIVWGLLNALYFLPLIFNKRHRKNLGVVAQGKYLPTFKELFQMLFTFTLTLFAWIFFRSENLETAISYISNLFSPSLFIVPELLHHGSVLVLMLFIVFFLIIEWLGRENEHAIEKIVLKLKRPLRYSFYFALILMMFWFGGKPQDYIYFQF